jgi:hypothetical protein
MVSVGIMIVILTITLSGRPEAITRLSLADSISSTELLLRQVQLQGSSVNSINGSFGGAGVFFTRSTSSQVLSFKDRIDDSVPSVLGVGDGLYTASPIDEKYEVITFSRTNKIGKLCVSMSTSTLLCNSENDPAIQSLTISYSRPSTQADIYINNSTSTKYVSACIQFDANKSPTPGYVRSIVVYRSGMITKLMGTCN